MPRKDFDYEKWVNEMKISDELKAQLIEAGKVEDNRNAFADTVIRHADYSKTMNDVAAERKALTAKEAAVAALQEELAASAGQSTAQVATLTSRLQAAERAAFDAAQKMRTEYNAYGNADEVITAIGLDKLIDVSKLPVEQKQPTTAGQQPTFDESKFINRDQATVMIDFNAQLYDLAADHQVLFNGVKDAKPFRASELLAEVKKGKDPAVAFDELYGATQRRADLQRASIEAELRVKLDAEYQAKVDALATSPARIQGQVPAPIQNDMFGEALKGAINDKAGEGQGFFAPPSAPGQAGAEQAQQVRLAALNNPTPP